ncbi:hypothetical protein JTF06_12180 [Desemzia sp. RIT804]|uniref:hypothetical protein n=1 Tax=Desemzia sp. RIT 804 TaxID=2810209 RepID=UPI0019528888|nr:hypothetical protein [Desemzia sp. RIT 804]MBM6615644.1 hypothetical protein [Desemzia sp. RIT 804]
MKKIRSFVWERRSSFIFTVGSIAYGFYHFFKPRVISHAGAYEALNFILGFLSGRYFGLLFIMIATAKLYGIITDNTQLRLSLYFALLFLWILLAIGFFISFIQGNDNAAWIYTLIIAGLSTNIISAKPALNGREIDG